MAEPDTDPNAGQEPETPSQSALPKIHSHLPLPKQTPTVDFGTPRTGEPMTPPKDTKPASGDATVVP